jgi:AcrR family transcriptional regulator
VVPPSSRPPRPLRTQPPEVRREQILDAAARVFTERGIAATSMAEVATAAGVAKGTLYLYFDSKELLVDAVAGRYHRVVVDEAVRLRTDDGPLADRLARFAGATFDHHRANLAMHHLLAQETGLREEGWLQTVEEEVVGALTAARVDRPSATARFLVYGLHGLLVAHLHRARPSRRAFLGDAVPLVTRLVAGPPAGR